ncbi:MAG: phenylalanine--tRNA ligase subunit beta [Pedosphaera sp.]|nr:phenylalanine--tRNA ligase subunit beta [Pedosphaera sp.]
MKVTRNWLKNYVDFDWSPADLTERLTMLGLEVEGVETLGGEFSGIVVALVLSRDKHPNADKLSVCRVADGLGERQIVCGAQNFQAGDKVPLILPGNSLPPKPDDKEPFVIKVGKIRGVESHGMLCSPQELGLLDAVDGLLLLKPESRVGQPFAEYLGRSGSDVVFDLEVTPNRPDLNSVIGIAREIAAITGGALKIPPADLPAETEPALAPASELLAVRLDAPDLCPRYNARIIQGVQIGPSPDWLRQALEKVGLRSVNNVVDVTNFVMLETGQPLHAFDFHLIAKSGERPTIVIRRGNAGEQFTTLDGRSHRVTSENLLIADEQKCIALAGVMGGQNTEIKPETTDVLLESACFAPTNIRRTSKSLGLRTDASYRFERGSDIGVVDYASRRAAGLILATAGGHIAAGAVEVYPQPTALRHISLRHARVNQLLGLNIPGEWIDTQLTRLDIRKIATTAPGVVTFSVPTFRVDLKREVDLIEEVARLHGVDKIPATAPRGATGEHPFDAVYDQFASMRRILVGLGLKETQGQTLIASGAASMANADPMMLANPLSAEMDALRPSLLPGLLDTLRHNATRRNNDVQVFEIGRVFNRENGRVKESWRVAIAMTGLRDPLFWSGADREARCDSADLKGRIEEVLEQFGVRGAVFARRPEASSLFLESAVISLGGKLVLGELGQVSPRLARQNDLRDPVFLAELDVDQLIARRNPARSFRALPAFPSVRRDVAMIVPEAITHGSILGVVRQARPTNLEAVELFDIFRGKQVPEGQKSMAYAFTYRSADKTLTDSEVTTTHAALVESFRRTLQAVIRE